MRELVDIPALLRGELSEEEERRAWEIIEQDPQLVSELTEWQELINQLKMLSNFSRRPKGIWREAIRLRAEFERYQKRRRRKKAAIIVGAVATAAVIPAMVVGAILIRRWSR